MLSVFKYESLGFTLDPLCNNNGEQLENKAQLVCPYPHYYFNDKGRDESSSQS